MPHISRDPDEIPETPPELISNARKLGYQVMLVVLEDDGDVTQFWAASPSRPGRGDVIVTADGRPCLVDRVVYATQVRDFGVLLFPTVFAVAEP